jgi:hypothetical protein
VRTIYVSGIKDSTTEDVITLFFETKKRTGGGDLCEGSEGLARVAPTVVRLKFVSSKGIVSYTRKNAQVVANLQQACSNVVPTTSQHDMFALLVSSLSTSCQRHADDLLQGC